ncbi:sensor histidine kinase [bacterium]|nr:sensor histidine kinase [bacterium]
MEIFECNILKKIALKSSIVFFVSNYDENFTIENISTNISQYGYSKKDILENSLGLGDFLSESNFNSIKSHVNKKIRSRLIENSIILEISGDELVDENSVNIDIINIKEFNQIANILDNDSNITLEVPLNREESNNIWIRIELNIDINDTSDCKIAGFFFNITKERNLIENYSHSQKMEAVGRLASGIAHEINTPLQYIQDNSFFLGETFVKLVELINQPNVKNILKERDISNLSFFEEEIPAALDDISTGIASVKSIVGAMREFAHTGNETRNPQDINHAIENCKTITRNQWKYNSDLILNLDTTIPMVNCNIEQINQVLINLIMNSIYAVKEVFLENNNQKGVIYITTKKSYNFVEITIEDSGKGIPKEIRDKIFELFFTTKEVGVGTGQGLAISYDIIVNKHKGKLILNDSKKGASFSIYLPI